VFYSEPDPDITFGPDSVMPSDFDEEQLGSIVSFSTMRALAVQFSNVIVSLILVFDSVQV